MPEGMGAAHFTTETTMNDTPAESIHECASGIRHHIDAMRAAFCAIRTATADHLEMEMITHMMEVQLAELDKLADKMHKAARNLM